MLTNQARLAGANLVKTIKYHQNMKFTLILTALLAFAAISYGADEPKKKGGGDPEAAFKKLDKDGDGSLSLEEFKAGAKDPAKAEEQFKKLDKDGNGKLSLEEFKARGGKKKADK